MKGLVKRSKQKIFHYKNVILAFYGNVKRKMKKLPMVLDMLPEALAWMLQLIMISMCFYWIFTIDQSDLLDAAIRIGLCAVHLLIVWLISAVMYHRHSYEVKRNEHNQGG